MAEITLELLVEHLGEPTIETKNEVHWQCPYCASEGGDTNENNLVYSKVKNIVKCFVHDSHSPNVLKDIFSKTTKNKIKYNNKPRVNAKPENPENIEKQQHVFQEHMIRWNRSLLEDELLLSRLEEIRGINKDTVEFCKIGTTYSLCWAFPTFKYTIGSDVSVTGFEYRAIELSKKGIHREKNTKTCMAMINQYNPKQTCLAILEGYLDAYTFAQHLKEQGQLEYYHIATPSNGVANIVQLMTEIDYNFNRYKRIYIYLDSDDAGMTKMEEIKQLYPFVETKIMTCGCKDFNEHYLRCIKGNEIKEGENK